jgi:uncharacterized protein (DUF2141 family)
VLFCFGAAAGELKAEIQGVASSSGTLMVGLYDSDEHFRSAIANAGKAGLLNDSARLVGISMRAVAGSQRVVFTNLKRGAYAVIVFHGENDNGKLDDNMFGVPTDGYGSATTPKVSSGRLPSRTPPLCLMFMTERSKAWDIRGLHAKQRVFCNGCF